MRCAQLDIDSECCQQLNADRVLQARTLPVPPLVGALHGHLRLLLLVNLHAAKQSPTLGVRIAKSVWAHLLYLHL